MRDISRLDPATEPVVRFTRTFDAPAEAVWLAFTDPARFARWWGPWGHANPEVRLDVRPGGRWEVMHRTVGGDVHRFHGQYVAVEPPRRLVQTMRWEDSTPSEEMLQLVERDGRTTVTATARYDWLAVRDMVLNSGMMEGAQQTYDRLADLLAGGEPDADTEGREIVHARTVSAPRERVFAAFTDPEILPRWWGPAGFSCTTEAIDLRPGGEWRFAMTGPDGHAWPNRIRWEEISAPHRIAFRTDEGRDDDPMAFRSTVTLADRGDGTTGLAVRIRFDAPEACATVRALGAEEMGRTTLDCLEEELLLG